jgi:hypothetical protein
LPVARYGGSFHGPGCYDGAGWRGDGEGGRESWRRVWLVGLANYFRFASERARGDLGRTRALSGPMQTWRKFGVGMGRTGHVGPNASHRWKGAGDAPVESDQFERAWTRCIDPLEMP